VNRAFASLRYPSFLNISRSFTGMRWDWTALGVVISIARGRTGDPDLSIGLDGHRLRATGQTEVDPSVLADRCIGRSVGFTASQ